MKKYIAISFVLSFFYMACTEKKSEKSLEPTEQATNSQEKKQDLPKMVFFGDSLTAGMGLASPQLAFPYLIGEKLKKDGYAFKIVNAGMSGDTTSGGLQRIDWVLSEGADVFILELGANDSMRGISPEVVEKNLLQIIAKVRETKPKAKILLLPMQTFPNMGPKYAKKFAAVYQRVATKAKIPQAAFLLEKVGGIARLNQEDGIHPTAEGHVLVAETIYPDVAKLVAKFFPKQKME